MRSKQIYQITETARQRECTQAFLLQTNPKNRNPKDKERPKDQI